MEKAYSVFPRWRDGKISLITVAKISPEERRELRYVITARLRYEAQDNGLPPKAEHDRVSDLETALNRELSRLKAEHIGHITFDGSTVAVYRSSEMPPDSVSIKTGLFKKENIPLITFEDPDWKWHEEEMESTRAEREEVKNLELHMQLKKSGDDNTKPRKVEYAALFPTAADRSCFLEAIEQQGFQTSDGNQWEPEGAPPQFWCTFHRVTDILATTMGAICAQLGETAEKFNGEYDGWVTPVTK